MARLLKAPGYITTLVFSLLATGINTIALGCLLIAYHANPDKHLLEHPLKGRQ